MSTQRRSVFVSTTLVLLLGIGIVLISGLLRRQEEEYVKERMGQFSRLMMVNLETFFRKPANALVLMADIYRDRRIRSHDDFSYYATQVFGLIPGLRTISIADEDYQLIYQLPVVNLAHNLKSYPDRYVFAETARKTRQLTVTNPVRLVRDGRPGFAVYVPVFRDERFAGLLIGVFDLERVVDTQLKPIFEDIPFALVTPGGSTFYRTAGSDKVNFDDAYSLRVSLADNAWYVRVPRTYLAANAKPYSLQILLVALVLTTAVCFLLLYLFQTVRLDLQREAAKGVERSYVDVSSQFRVKLDENAALYHQLEKAQGDLVKATRMATLGELSAVIAHEIRNPLTAVVNCIETLRRSAPEGGEDSSLLDLSLKETLRLNHILSDLLSFARLRRLSLQRVGMANLLDEVSWAFSQDGRWNSTIRITRQCDSTCPNLELDVDLMKQVFWNLVTNAAHAMPDGGEIRLCCSSSDGKAQVEVQDSGKGIPADVQPRVFEPFFSTKAAGVGLGLFIVKQIVEENGGRVTINSAEGKGTSVWMTLPLDRKEPPNVALDGG